MHCIHRLVALPAVVALSGLTLLITSQASAQTSLRWQFKPGQVLNQKIDQNMKMSITAGGQTYDTTVVQNVDAVWKVGQVDESGVADVDQEITRIQMKMTAPMGLGFEFDSSADSEPQGLGAMMAPTLKAMAKAKFTMKMNPQGEVLDVEVSQDTLDALKTMPGGGQAGGGMLTKESLVNMIKQGTPTLPKDPVQSGASWSNSMEMALSQVGTMASDTKSTYVGPEEVEGTTLQRINLDLTTRIVPTEGVAAKVSLTDENASGRLYFDNSAGRLSHSELVQDMTMQVSEAGKNFDQRIQQTIKVKLTPAN